MVAETSSDGRSERWRSHRAARRQELILGAVAAVRERGALLGMDDVAAVSGVTKPVFYRYFSDKADLFRAVGRWAAEDVVAEVELVVGLQSEPRDMLVAGINAFLTRLEVDGELYRFVLHPPLGKGDVDDTVGDYSTVLGLRIARIIGDRLREAGLDSGAAEPWGFGIVGTVRAAGERWLDNRTMSREALSAYLVELLWGGLLGAVARSVPAGDAQGRR